MPELTDLQAALLSFIIALIVCIRLEQQDHTRK